MRLRIGILGTRGVPNQYGGFEQLAQHLSAGLVRNGHEVFVYSSHDHIYQEKQWQGVRIVHCYDPEQRVGSAAQFIYDLNCIMDARKRNLDVWLMLGYTSSSVWGRLFPRKSVVITNMDGMEWKRSKYNWLTRIFLKQAEKMAARHSDFFVADSLPIYSYLENKYVLPLRFIAYGAEQVGAEDNAILAKYKLAKNEYFLLISRMEEENNVELILDGMSLSNTSSPFIVVGNTHNAFGRRLRKKFADDGRIHFVQGIYDAVQTHTLRRHCRCYFHGHSVGGTNPSLLEAMASGAVVAAHKNPFNASVLGEDGYYFHTAGEVAALLSTDIGAEKKERITQNNLAKIQTRYNWPLIIGQYEEFIKECFDSHG